MSGRFSCSPGALPPAWAFGPDDFADEGACLVLEGRKTATSSLHELQGIEDERLPKLGGRSILLDGHGRAVCLSENVSVEIVPFGQVGAAHAAAEGEGDLTLAHWRRAQCEDFTEWLAEVGRELSDDTPVLCETFRVAFLPSAR